MIRISLIERSAHCQVIADLLLHGHAAAELVEAVAACPRQHESRAGFRSGKAQRLRYVQPVPLLRRAVITHREISVGLDIQFRRNDAFLSRRHGNAARPRQRVEEDTDITGKRNTGQLLRQQRDIAPQPYWRIHHLPRPGGIHAHFQPRPDRRLDRQLRADTRRIGTIGILDRLPDQTSLIGMGVGANRGEQREQQGEARSWRHILSPGKLRAHRVNPAGTVKA